MTDRVHTNYDLTIHGDVVLDDGTVTPNTWIGIRNGVIAALSAEPLPSDSHHDASGKLIFPGVVDAHVHTRSNPDEGITNATRAAAAGGTTTVVDMPFDRPARPVNTREVFESKAQDVEEEAIVDVALYATFPPTGSLDCINELAAAGAAGFKVSTIEVDPIRFPRIPDGRLFEAFQEIERTGLPVAAHQENQSIADTFSARASRQWPSDPIAHARSRPPVAEAEAAGRLLELAYWSGAHLHMVHGTIPRTFDLIDWHRKSGTLATGETCVHYLILDETALGKFGGRAKCNPPLRMPSDVEALWQQLADGQIDIVTSDHSPYPLANKDTTSIFDAYAGLPGAETLATLLFSEGVAKGRISLDTFVRVLCSGPADVFGFESKGRIRIGNDADLVVFDPGTRWVLDEDRMHYGDGWSTFHGHEVTGRVEATFVRGKLVFGDGVVTGEPGSGTFLRPG